METPTLIEHLLNQLDTLTKARRAIADYGWNCAEKELETREGVHVITVHYKKTHLTDADFEREIKRTCAELAAAFEAQTKR